MARGNTAREGRSARSELGASASSAPRGVVSEAGKIATKVAKYFADLPREKQDELFEKLKEAPAPELDGFIGSVKDLVVDSTIVLKSGAIDANKTLGNIDELERLEGMSLYNKYAAMVARDVFKNQQSPQGYFDYINDRAMSIAKTLITGDFNGGKKEEYSKALTDVYKSVKSRGFSDGGADATMRLVNMQAVAIMSKYLKPAYKENA